MYRFMGRELGQLNIAPEDVLIDDVPPTVISSKYCTNFPVNACIKASDEQVVRSRARSACAARPRVPQAKGLRGGLRGLHGLAGGLGKTCTIYSSKLTLTASNADLWDPCRVKDLPICRPMPPKEPTYVKEDTPVYVPQVEEPEPELEPEPEPEEEDTSYMVGGILAVLVLGGVGYAVFRNRKKKKGKRKR